ncbi:carboxypeptidase-like regulatory domain-containing protein [Flavobacterium plurextorum]|uniref:carboxypeptidase-like regulatory domain-containing protein n=1 Tax=Flavobacterium TaxID=237 RepID=UPI00214DD9DE|nr:MULTISPECIES: carboxypeptidase-like regulatory domain-containing protein [Flavobacterium]UUW10485.1 carboxypeptidase-like regulatory domain-containing protein [Flavobacterium plurextorum]
MKVKLLTTISFFTYQISIAQTEKLLRGKVVSNNSPLNKVEVINKTAKTSTRTNERGEFSIIVKAQDSLIFFAKDYLFTRLKITAKEIETNNLIIDMIPKPEELNEVIVAQAIKPVFLSKEDIKEIKLNSHKSKEGLKIQGFHEVKGGPLDMDFIRMGKEVYNLFKREKKEPKKGTSEINFRNLIITTCTEDFFFKDLKLNSEEKELFLQFCDADPKSKRLLENPNILNTMDFLYTKNEDFKKLKTEIKN